MCTKALSTASESRHLERNVHYLHSPAVDVAAARARIATASRVSGRWEITQLRAGFLPITEGKHNRHASGRGWALRVKSGAQCFLALAHVAAAYANGFEFLKCARSGSKLLTAVSSTHNSIIEMGVSVSFNRDSGALSLEEVFLFWWFPWKTALSCV